MQTLYNQGGWNTAKHDAAMIRLQKQNDFHLCHHSDSDTLA